MLSIFVKFYIDVVFVCKIAFIMPQHNICFIFDCRLSSGNIVKIYICKSFKFSVVLGQKFAELCPVLNF